MSLEEIQIEIEEKLAGVCSALEDLRDQQQILSENAEKLKSSVKDSVNGHVKDLRNREKQIVRQIEVITTHQKSILEIQIAKALHLKGSLNATKSILAKCEPEDSVTLSKIKDNSLPSQRPVTPLKLVSVQLEGNALSSAIMDYGKISFPQSITCQDLSIFPPKMEEYEDSEHEVLHKSLRGTGPSSSLPESPLKITVCFPKLPTNGWLAHSGHNKTVINSVEKPLSADVSSWLSNLRISQSPEDERSFQKCCIEVEEEDGFQMVPTSTPSRCLDNKIRNSESSSIEIINGPEDISHTPEMETSDSNTSNTQWLRESPTIDISFINVPSACQANETCPSFNDCVCDDLCKKYALKKAIQTARWLRKQRLMSNSYPACGKKKEILNHMLEILESDPAQWLVKRHNSSLSAPDKRVLYRSRSSLWLHKHQHSRSSPTCFLSDFEQKQKNMDWIIHESLGSEEHPKRKQFLDEENSEIKSHPYQSISVESLKTALAELEEILPKYSPGKDSLNVLRSTSSNSPQDKKMNWLLRNSNPVSGTLNLLTTKPDLPETVIALADTDLNKWLHNKL